jgi:hypothetical protein
VADGVTDAVTARRPAFVGPDAHAVDCAHARMRLGTATAVCIAALSVTGVARADQPVSLAWNAPPGCPLQEAVLGDVQRILGTTTSHRATARADVTQLGPERWSLHLSTEVDGVPGERSLEANSCASLATAAALILAWTVDPEKARAAMPTQPPDVVQKPPEVATQPPRASWPFAWVVAASGAGNFGTLNVLEPGVEIAAGALIGPLRFELSGAYWAMHGITDPQLQYAAGTTIFLLDGAVRGCFRGRLAERFELDPCLAAALVYGNSSGFNSGLGASSAFKAEQNDGAWFAMRAELLAVWRLVGPIGLRASAGVEWTPAPPNFVLDRQLNGVQTGSDTLYGASAIAGRGTLGVEVRFP